jgi:steroid delta-isomerase-like uncharacterized protein
MRIKLFAMVLWAVATACNTSPKAAATDTIENEKIVRQLFEAFNRHDWKTMVSYYADSAEFFDPSFGTEYVKKSTDETAAKYAEMEKMFPDLHDEVVSMLSQGDKVVVEFTSSGSAEAQKFKLPISTIFTIQNGKIVRDATYYNNCQE